MATSSAGFILCRRQQLCTHTLMPYLFLNHQHLDPQPPSISKPIDTPDEMPVAISRQNREPPFPMITDLGKIVLCNPAIERRKIGLSRLIYNRNCLKATGMGYCDGV